MYLPDFSIQLSLDNLVSMDETMIRSDLDTGVRTVD